MAIILFNPTEMWEPNLLEPYRQPIGPVEIYSELISELGLKNVYFPRNNVRERCLVTGDSLIVSGTRTSGRYGMGTAYAAEAYYSIPDLLPNELTIFGFFHAKITDGFTFSYGPGALRNAAGFRAVHVNGQNKAIDHFKISFTGNVGSKAFSLFNNASGWLDGGNYFVFVATRKSSTEHYVYLRCPTDSGINFSDSDLVTPVTWTVSPLTRFYPVGDGVITGETLLSGWADKYWSQSQIKKFLSDPYSIFRLIG